MRTRVLVHATLIGMLVALALVPPAEAQRGLGKARNRAPEQAPPEVPVPGEYSLDGPQAALRSGFFEGKQGISSLFLGGLRPQRCAPVSLRGPSRVVDHAHARLP